MKKSGTFRVVSFNIQHGALGDYGRGYPELVAEACREFNADIIGLQEVDVGVPRSKYAHLAEIAAEACGMDYVFKKTGTFRGRGAVGVAILVRGEIDKERVYAPKIRGERHTVGKIQLTPMPRNILIAPMIVKGNELTAGNTHFGGPNRRRMLGQAAAILAANEGPIVMTMDSNLGWLETQACLEPHGLYVIKDELRSPDHIAVRGLSGRVGKHFLDSGLSDHHPVLGDFVIGDDA